MPGTTEIVKKV